MLGAQPKSKGLAGLQQKVQPVRGKHEESDRTADQPQNADRFPSNTVDQVERGCGVGNREELRHEHCQKYKPSHPFARSFCCKKVPVHTALRFSMRLGSRQQQDGSGSEGYVGTYRGPPSLEMPCLGEAVRRDNNASGSSA